MKNYFENADVNWKNWQPRDVIFKSGIISKKYMEIGSQIIKTIEMNNEPSLRIIQ